MIDFKKDVSVGYLIKGGEGSGSWDGPGQPRFAHDEVSSEKPSEKPAGTGGGTKLPKDFSREVGVGTIDGEVKDSLTSTVVRGYVRASFEDVYRSLTDHGYKVSGEAQIRANLPAQFENQGATRTVKVWPKREEKGTKIEALLYK